MLPLPRGVAHGPVAEEDRPEKFRRLVLDQRYEFGNALVTAHEKRQVSDGPSILAAPFVPCAALRARARTMAPRGARLAR